MKLLVVFLLIISSQCFSQNNVTGNWLTVSYWSVFYIKMKKNGKVIQFTADCKDRGTKRTGNWFQQNDTIYINTEKRSSIYLLRDNKLCQVDDDGEISDPKYGISRTKAKTIVAAKRRIKRIRKRD